MPLNAGARLGPYEIVNLLGAGGMGEVIPSSGLSVQRIFDLTIPLADAVAAAHQHDIVHRDLKPASTAPA